MVIGEDGQAAVPDPDSVRDALTAGSGVTGPRPVDTSAGGLRAPRHLREGRIVAGRHGRPAHAPLSTDQQDSGPIPGPDPGPDPRREADTAVVQVGEASPAADVGAPPAARTESPPEAPAPIPSMPGPWSAGVTVEAGVTGVTATVILSRDGVEHVGWSRLAAPAGVGGRAVSGATRRALSVVAAATLQALDDLVGDQVQLRVDSVALMPVGVARVAIATVLWVSPDGSERLTGSAGAGDDARHAMVRATVDAVNRRLEAPFLFS